MIIRHVYFLIISWSVLYSNPGAGSINHPQEKMNKIKSLNWSDLIILFAVPTLLNLIACKIAIPLLDTQRLFPVEVNYFISVGILVLAPMFFAALYMSAREIKSFQLKDIFSRMRIRSLSLKDSI